jgi:6-phosphofructokinase 1
MITRQAGAIVPVPFADIMDPTTGRTRVRLVDTKTEAFASALSLQVRIEREDLESDAHLAAFAKRLKISPEDVKARYAGAV